MNASKTLRTLINITKYSAVVSASTVAIAAFSKEDVHDLFTYGVIRFGRAFIAVAITAADYKWSLRNVPRNTETYSDIISTIHSRSALRLRNLCCVNGGVFIKVGQHIGSLEYLLPPEYVQTMKVLHDNAPLSPLDQLFRVVKEDFGCEVDQIFSDFDRTPLGAASLAQVHKASLSDGTIVAVKIQHPNVRAHSRVDILTMKVLFDIVSWIFPQFQYGWIAEETERNLPIELNFVNEAQNCEKICRLLKHFNFFKVPKIYWRYTSERVLTMEYCDGGHVNDLDYMRRHHIPISEVCRKLGKLYSEMIFVHGYVHCDPHPGNVLINNSSGDVKVILLDHGLYQSMTDEFRINYCHLWMSLIKGDIEAIKQYAIKLNAGDLYGLLACIVSHRSWNSITVGIDKVARSDKEDTHIQEYAYNSFPQITAILNRIPRQMLLILKTNDVLRGIEHSLDVRSDASAFINMSRCCVRAVNQHQLTQCQTRWARWRANLHMYWSLFTILVYELALSVSNLVSWKSRMYIDGHV